MKTTVVHCKKAPFDVSVGRSGKWGNPFSHLKGTKAMFLCKDRNEAVASYRKWITEGEGKHLMKDLHQLKGKKIACWCKPQSCHGDILAELAEEQESYKDFQIIRKLDNTMVQRNYLQIKKDIQDIIQSEMERLLNDPGLSHLVVKK